MKAQNASSESKSDKWVGPPKCIIGGPSDLLKRVEKRTEEFVLVVPWTRV